MKFALVVLSLLATAWGKEAVQPIEEMGDFFEGDIELTDVQRREIFGRALGRRTGIIDTRYRWPNNTLIYDFASDVNWEQRNYVELALRNISGHTCVKFARRTNQRDYVLVTTDVPGCSSNYGRIGGMQTVKLKWNVIESGCWIFGTIIHEFIHALGFYHTQAAYNRDDYVKILWENITPGKEHNFNIKSRTQTTMFELPYDYGSVMHYGGNSFSDNGRPTIIPFKSGVTIGQREAMSQLDIKRINRMYNCPYGQ